MTEDRVASSAGAASNGGEGRRGGESSPPVIAAPPSPTAQRDEPAPGRDRPSRGPGPLVDADDCPPHGIPRPSERAVRLLRAKAAELENQVKLWPGVNHHYHADLAADIALVASLLADYLERSQS